MNYIKKIGSNWYNFESIDQSKRYIKVQYAKFSTDRRAINFAKKLLGDKKMKVSVI